MFDSLPGYTSVYYCKQSYLKGERKNSCFHHLVCLCLRFRTTPKNCLSDFFEMNKVFSNAADFFSLKSTKQADSLIHSMLIYLVLNLITLSGKLRIR